jgi:hypothetical protein
MIAGFFPSFSLMFLTTCGGDANQARNTSIAPALAFCRTRRLQVCREAVLSQVDIDISQANIDVSLCFGSLYAAI